MRRQWHPTPVLLPGKSHGRRSLVGCSPWGREESDTTERLHFHFSLSCIGEGNGNPLQCSCLETPRDCGAWWAAVYGVAQRWTRLKRLSSSSTISIYWNRTLCAISLYKDVHRYTCTHMCTCSLSLTHTHTDLLNLLNSQDVGTFISQVKKTALRDARCFTVGSRAAVWTPFSPVWAQSLISQY